MFHPLGLHQGFNLDLGWVVYIIPRFSVELDTFTPTAFDQFIVIVISTTATFSLLTNFVSVLWTKFLKKINKKTTYKNFTKHLPLFFSLVLR